MDALAITGRWEGAFLSDQGGIALPFVLQQPAGALAAASGPELQIGAADALPVRLLDGAARVLVALIDEVRDPVSGRLAQLLVDARVHGDQLVGCWFRRDDAGRIVGSGRLTAHRIVNFDHRRRVIAQPLTAVAS